ncbi:amino acid ABC transporter permease [Lichenifustis flavocetrariae]|uniref:Amino acid ABC transporter permease n=1 Tax=Lichenifustis flavocetrariae TaxID=2949735 RepID=A0AA41Z146_9HYPH|nr:amino acid ABC transporter permease [Lichenifustis flavocetrariae]MCW6511814.1 amino acid ABC transporter permease [Lichenifustis flavocetrariae]
MTDAFAVLRDHAGLLAQGLLLTVLLASAGIVAGLVLAVPLALAKLSRHRVVRGLGTELIELLRNMPFVVLLVVVHFGAPRLLIRFAPSTSGVVALALYGAAYFAEVLRGAFLSVPRGQTEGAHALGLTGRATLIAVVAPQTTAAAVPPGRVVAVMLLKDSAVLSIISVPELTHAAMRIQAESFATVPVFAALALLYWLMTLGLSAAVDRLEARTRLRRRTSLRGSTVAARYLALDWPLV